METYEGLISTNQLDADKAAAQKAADPEDARLREIERALSSKPFRPHPLFRSGHAQTLAAFAWPRRSKYLAQHATDEARRFEVEPGVELLAHCRWQKERLARPTLLLVHGLEGSSSSVYMLSTAHLAYHSGFNVLRLNQRNCGATEHLTPTLYHSGMSGDLAAIVRHLVERDRLPRIFLAGFSMGGNLALKMAGEMAGDAPPELRGVCAVSPSLNLSECAQAIGRRSNWIYQQSFMRSLRRRIRHKHKLFPALYDTRGLRRVRTVRDFDERYTSHHGGFKGADDYYERSSALSFVPRIRIPALIVHAQDDPLVPFDSFRHPLLTNNPRILLLAPQHGGHVAFLSASENEEERFWAEQRLVEFCRLIESKTEG
ncbi:MAG TPA: alpha/beta fold hydrolase [Pyrinomonadaceae bacterium]|jgi:hypothetical protein